MRTATKKANPGGVRLISLQPVADMTILARISAVAAQQRAARGRSAATVAAGREDADRANSPADDKDRSCEARPGGATEGSNERLSMWVGGGSR